MASIWNPEPIWDPSPVGDWWLGSPGTTPAQLHPNLQKDKSETRSNRGKNIYVPGSIYNDARGIFNMCRRKMTR